MCVWMFDDEGDDCARPSFGSRLAASAVRACVWIRTGYRAYFNDKEWAFAQTVGNFWTNFARYAAPEAPSVAATAATKWPATDATGKGGVVLDANLDGGSAIEVELYDSADYCKFWD